MSKHFAISCLLCLSNLVFSQNLGVGIVFGPNIYKQVSLEKPIHTPPGSLHTYIEAGPGEGVLKKHGVASGYHLGAIFSFDYKRLTVNLEPQYYHERLYVEFERPFYIERIVGTKAFHLPIYATYRFFRKKSSPYFLAGFNFITENNTDFQDPYFDYYFLDDELYEYEVFVGDRHFEGALYDDRAYFNIMAGLGRKTKNWAMAFRFQTELNFTNHSVEANIWKVDLSFNYLILSSRDFTKKHFLYVE